jgi:hypothetical protein|tara:strand:- start:373 stop:522 length:150 start_codon:yes stop_codon:yes gene_type:complete
MIKRYVKSQIKKHGVKGFVIKVLELIAKVTPSKEDDKIVAKIKIFVAGL